MSQRRMQRRTDLESSCLNALIAYLPSIPMNTPTPKTRAKLPLTPEMLEGANEYLRVSPPFRAWNLPHADHVSFRVMTTRDRFGHFRGRHRKATDENQFSEI